MKNTTMNDVILIDSTHLIERDDEQDPSGKSIRSIPALENIDGNLVEAHNQWEFSWNPDGTLSLYSYAAINEHYEAYPNIIIKEKEARELLAFLQARLAK